jgi:molybdopterin converting factor small subunit
MADGSASGVLACDNTGVDPAPRTTDETAVAATTASVTVRYWASARAAVGRSEDRVDAESVDAVLSEVRRLHAANPRLLQVLSVSSLLLGDRPLGTSDLTTVRVHSGDVLEVLPPFAGG